MKITERQVGQLEAIILERFLTRVTAFLMVEMPGQMARLADPAEFVRTQYGIAKQTGRKTERAIAQYILDALSVES